MTQDESTTSEDDPPPVDPIGDTKTDSSIGGADNPTRTMQLDDVDVPTSLPERFGPFKIERLIGAGGMGMVYEARQENPNRVVALKVMKPGATTEKYLQRFELEAQVLGRLQHPGIAHIYEAGADDDGRAFFAMELIRGMPFNALCRST